ncbi:MAG: hypothetical protein H0W08_09065 [Acidobacteria bacterium]|nr:hypothetical protein [Acidobacteriota bacterium]
MTDFSPPQRSLKHEYELYVEREVERYKDSVPRSVILRIGDDAVAALSAQPQLALTELMLCGEVDRLIASRLGLSTFRAWRRRHLKALQKYRRPEHWGIRPDAPLVRAIAAAAESHVLIAGATEAGPAMYLAANGCAVTALDGHLDAIDRVMSAAEAAGLTRRVRGYLTDFRSWVPDAPVDAVLYSPLVFDGLNTDDRADVIARLQGATTEGGVHLIQSATAAAVGSDTRLFEELHAQYAGWRTSVERQGDARSTFFARKTIA